MDDAGKRRIIWRMENWGRHVRDSSGEPHGRCGSIEGRYLPERYADELKLDRFKQPPIDVLDALEVEKSICALHPERLRLVLKIKFVDRSTKEDAGREMKMHWTVWNAAIDIALWRVAGLLEKASVKAHGHRQLATATALAL